MKLKLTNDQMMALKKVVETVLEMMPSDKNPVRELHRCMLQYIQYELAKKVLRYKATQSFTFKPEWAISFWMLVNPLYPSLDEPFTKNLLRIICDQINKKYL